ncbi:MAG: DUF6790 family protein [Pseudomonadota bacterium]
MSWKARCTKYIEYFRFFIIFLAIFISNYLAAHPVEAFHYMAILIIIGFSGTIAFEGLILGEFASAKIGYTPSRAYQVQSALYSLAITIAAIISFVLNWGLFADLTIITVLSSFLVLSSTNHAYTAIKDKNYKITNILRPIMTLAFLAIIIPMMLKAINY